MLPKLCFSDICPLSQFKDWLNQKDEGNELSIAKTQQGVAPVSPGSSPQNPPAPVTRAALPSLPLIGWKEDITFTQLPLPPIAAKIDTGADSSALHATDISYEEREGKRWVRFVTHPDPDSTDPAIPCAAPVLKQRTVRNSGGQGERRPVIRTEIQLGTMTWPIDLTLTERTDMKFRMLLGREAICQRFWVEPSQPNLQSGRKETNL
ncbi:MAG: ATP-dependent zinc protease [Spirulinaceae cyanobacterium]